VYGQSRGSLGRVSATGTCCWPYPCPFLVHLEGAIGEAEHPGAARVEAGCARRQSDPRPRRCGRSLVNSGGPALPSGTRSPGMRSTETSEPPVLLPGSASSTLAKRDPGRAFKARRARLDAVIERMDHGARIHRGGPSVGDARDAPLHNERGEAAETGDWKGGAGYRSWSVFSQLWVNKIRAKGRSFVLVACLARQARPGELPRTPGPSATAQFAGRWSKTRRRGPAAAVAFFAV